MTNKTPHATGFADGPMAVAEVGLALLRSEMELLRAVMPGAAIPGTTIPGATLPGTMSGPEDEAARLLREAEVEDSFDNMPV